MTSTSHEAPASIRLNAPRCAAWSEAILRYWQKLRATGRLDLSQALDIVGVLPPGDVSFRPLLDTLNARATSVLGFPARIRYASLAPDAPHKALLALEPTGNPTVFLLHDVLHRLPQRLLAVHYGRLLEADLRAALQPQATHNETMWQPATVDAQEPEIAELSREYLQEFNSAPLCLPTMALALIDTIHAHAGHGYLVLVGAPGTCSRHAVRMLDTGAVIGRYAQDRTLPVNFELMLRRWERHGAAVWQREIMHGWSLQAVVAGADDAKAMVERCVVPLDGGDHGDIPELVAAMRAVVRQDGPAAVLALLRRAHFDLEVFAAACPQLHRRWQGGRNIDRPAWSQALHAVWAQCAEDARTLQVQRDLAYCAMGIAEWSLAKKVWRNRLAIGGGDARDLCQLAWCHVHTGDHAKAMSDIECAELLGPGDPGVVQIRRSIQHRLAAMDDPWRKPIVPPCGPLTLEPLDMLHKDAMKHQYRDPQIAAMAAMPVWPAGDDTADWFTEHFLGADRRDYAVMHRNHGFVGHVALDVTASAAMFMFWIGVDFQGRGLSVEAGRLLCAHARALGVQWIFTTAYDDNCRSLRALARIGFRRLPLRSTKPESPRTCLLITPPSGSEREALAALEGYYTERDLPMDFEVVGADEVTTLD
ncbi:GNAT family N-acetyltransferase [Variovorax sp. KK3]|uniref:GNAT family N-acetyltransferase n=1 Tax=Variovorax sp. KK3 TaxID=1855728 RepID=UPI00097BEE49|nr:GNAT family N-acetyltransferase [Variovorax sp. KK3]